MPCRKPTCTESGYLTTSPTPSEETTSNWLLHPCLINNLQTHVLRGPQSLARGGVVNGYLLGWPHVDKGVAPSLPSLGVPITRGGDKTKNDYFTQAACLVGPHVGTTGIACMLTLGMPVFERTNQKLLLYTHPFEDPNVNKAATPHMRSCGSSTCSAGIKPRMLGSALRLRGYLRGHLRPTIPKGPKHSN